MYANSRFPISIDPLRLGAKGSIFRLEFTYTTAKVLVGFANVIDVGECAFWARNQTSSSFYSENFRRTDFPKRE
jgi:hypothetical protein